MIELYEDMDEDKLAKEEEVIESRAHSNEEGGYTYE